MSNQHIKTFLRLRGSISADPSDGRGPCFENVEGGAVKIPSLPNSGIFQPNFILKDGSNNDDLWGKFGGDLIEKLTDVSGSKTHSLISFWGSEACGKTFGCRGAHDASHGEEGFTPDSVLGKVVNEMSLHEDVLMCVWLFHQDSILDLSSGTDHMKPKMDEGISTVDNTGVCKVTSSAVALDHVQKCLQRRREFFDKSGSSESLTHLVFQFVINGSSLTIIEHASASVAHVPLPSLSAEQKKFLEEKNKVMAHINRLWVESATSADQKAIGWKDTKLGRFVQPGLGSAMDGTGFAILIVCAANVESLRYDALLAAQFATSSTKSEGLKSVSDYKTLIEEVEERIESRTKEQAPLKAKAAADEAEALRVKAANEARINELNGILRELDMKITSANEQADKDEQKLKASFEKRVADLTKRCADEVDRMRNLSSNAPAQAAEDIRKKIAEVDAEFKDKVKEVHDEIASIQKTIKNHKEALSEMVRVKNNRQKEEIDCMIPVKERERDLQRQQAALALAGKCREDGLSETEIIEKQSMWEARDEVDDLEEKAMLLAYDLMALEQGLEKGIGRPKAEGESSSESESDDSSDDSSDAESETESERLAREEEERLEREEEEREKLEAEREEKYQLEWEHFRDTIKKDYFLSQTVDTIGKYLAYGMPATVLDPKTGEFNRQVIFLMKRGRGIGITKVPPKGSDPDRRHPSRVIPFENCDGLHLGQHSPLFQHKLRAIGARKTVDRNFIPEDFTKINLYTFHEYYYRSVSLQHHENLFLDVIFDSTADFEAFIVHVHRHCTIPVGWGKKLNLEMCEGYEAMKPHERELCEELHMLPNDFVALRDKLLLDKRRLYLTLHDVRSIGNLDLYHCQRVLEVFLRRRWLVRKQLNYLKTQEEELDEEERTMQAARPPFTLEAKHAIEELEPIPLQRSEAQFDSDTGSIGSDEDYEEEESGGEESDSDSDEGDAPPAAHADPASANMGAPHSVAKRGLIEDDDDDDLLLGPSKPSHRKGLIDDDDEEDLAL